MDAFGPKDIIITTLGPCQAPLFAGGRELVRKLEPRLEATGSEHTLISLHARRLEFCMLPLDMIGAL